MYVGYTTNMRARLETHNSGGSLHTKKDRPWELIVCTVYNGKHQKIEISSGLQIREFNGNDSNLGFFGA